MSHTIESTALAVATTPGSHSEAEPGRTVLLKKIGSTIYQVGAHFSITSKETMSDKILRLIRSEVEDGRPVWSQENNSYIGAVKPPELCYTDSTTNESAAEGSSS